MRNWLTIVQAGVLSLALLAVSPITALAQDTGAPRVPPSLYDVRVIPASEVLYLTVRTDEEQGSWERAYVEMSRLAESLQLPSPEYESIDQAITFSLADGRQVYLKAGVPGAWLDGRIVKFDAAPIVLGNSCGDSRVYVPVRLVAEISGSGVAWSPDGSVVLYR